MDGSRCSICGVLKTKENTSKQANRLQCYCRKCTSIKYKKYQQKKRKKYNKHEMEEVKEIEKLKKELFNYNGDAIYC